MSAPSHGVLQSPAGASSEVVGRDAPQSFSHVSRVWVPWGGILTTLGVILRCGKAEAPVLAFGYAELVGHARVGDGSTGEGSAGDFSDSLPLACCFHGNAGRGISVSRCILIAALVLPSVSDDLGRNEVPPIESSIRQDKRRCKNERREGVRVPHLGQLPSL